MTRFHFRDWPGGEPPGQLNAVVMVRPLLSRPPSPSALASTPSMQPHRGLWGQPKIAAQMGKEASNEARQATSPSRQALYLSSLDYGERAPRLSPKRKRFLLLGGRLKASAEGLRPFRFVYLDWNLKLPLSAAIRYTAPAMTRTPHHHGYHHHPTSPRGIGRVRAL